MLKDWWYRLLFPVPILSILNMIHLPCILQPVDQHQRLSVCFDKLMADVARSLDSKNRDKFTQNLTVFRHEFRVK